MKPLDATAIPVDTSDEQLVAQSQAGSSEAFAVLFRRYRPAIARYVGRLLGDDARAEDVVQEVFLSALRGIQRLDRPAGFKPWLYRIAHNTCIDYMRRNRRGEEVSIDARLLPPAEEIRLFRQAPSTHTAVTQREDFKNLREAFSGLPPSQSEVLILRELEGLSYDEIADRMGVTRASVESMLFRARQGLRDEYGEIATGERCLRMRPVMARMAEGMSGLRDRRALARHVRGCASCRRDAYAMGLGGPALEAPATGLRGGLSRVASWLPLPWLIYRRDDDAGAASAGGGGGSFAAHAHSAMTQLGSTMGVGADQAATGIQKAVAVMAAVAVVGGGGIVATNSGSREELRLKPENTQTPARADVGPALPPALLPINPRTVAAVIGTSVPARAAVGGISGGDGSVLSAPALAPEPGGSPGTLDQPLLPDGFASPGEPTMPTEGGGDSPAGSMPDTTSGGDTSLPAAGGPAPSGDSGGGSGPSGGDPSGGGGGGGSDSGSGGTGSSGGGSGSGSGSGSGGGTGSSGGSGGGNGGNGGGGSGGGGETGGGGATPDPESSCDLPRGLDKKDKVTPGHEKRCLRDATEVAP